MNVQTKSYSLRVNKIHLVLLHDTFSSEKKKTKKKKNNVPFGVNPFV